MVLANATRRTFISSDSLGSRMARSDRVGLQLPGSTCGVEHGDDGAGECNETNLHAATPFVFKRISHPVDGPTVV
jgi:hypothetical protein